MPAAERDRAGWAALDPCVHCGFCLPACPTYLATGDESDSPRGRIMLMRALERGEIPANDPALVEHLDACLGCRGCEPVCPSGVAYGRGLETARETLARANSFSLRARAILAVVRRAVLGRAIFSLGRLLRRSLGLDLLFGRGFLFRLHLLFGLSLLILRLTSGRSGLLSRGWLLRLRSGLALRLFGGRLLMLCLWLRCRLRLLCFRLLCRLLGILLLLLCRRCRLRRCSLGLRLGFGLRLRCFGRLLVFSLGLFLLCRLLMFRFRRLRFRLLLRRLLFRAAFMLLALRFALAALARLLVLELFFVRLGRRRRLLRDLDARIATTRDDAGNVIGQWRDGLLTQCRSRRRLECER